MMIEQDKWGTMRERFTIVGGVLVLAVRDNKVLMLLRKNKFDDGLYSVPGGCMEECETVLQAATREFGEEVGVKVETKDMEVVSVLHRICPWGWTATEFVVLVKDFDGDPQIMEPNKCTELKWFAVDDLPENVSKYARQAIENFVGDVRFSQIDF